MTQKIRHKLNGQFRVTTQLIILMLLVSPDLISSSKFFRPLEERVRVNLSKAESDSPIFRSCQVAHGDLLSPPRYERRGDSALRQYGR